jgi:hypothetical protein
MPGKQVERRRQERSEDAEVWKEEDRETLLKLSGFFDKWNSRHGTKKQDEPKKDQSFLEMIGIKL